MSYGQLGSSVTFVSRAVRLGEGKGVDFRAPFYVGLALTNSTALQEMFADQPSIGSTLSVRAQQPSARKSLIALSHATELRFYGWTLDATIPNYLCVFYFS